MSGDEGFDAGAARLQALLAGLEAVADPAARSMARELARTVIDLHAIGLADLLGIVREAGSQPADTLVARFLANPALRGLLLLHGLHPDDVAARARQGVDRLNLRLGAHGLRLELLGAGPAGVRVGLREEGSGGHRPDAAGLEAMIERGLLEYVPDAAALVIEGLDGVAAIPVLPATTVVPLAALGGRRATGTG
jgi:hypothetical protein